MFFFIMLHILTECSKCTLSMPARQCTYPHMYACLYALCMLYGCTCVQLTHGDRGGPVLCIWPLESASV